MDTPLVHMHGVELGGDARLEYALVHGGGHSVAVVDHDDPATLPLARDGHEDALRMGVTRVAQHLYDDVLGGTDIVSRLATLRLGALQTDEAIPEVGLDPEMAVAANVLYELFKRIVGHAETRLT